MSFSATFQINLWHLDNENKNGVKKILKKYFYFHVRALCLLHYFLRNFKIIIEEKLQQICRVIGLSRDGPAYALLANKQDKVCRKILLLELIWLYRECSSRNYFNPLLLAFLVFAHIIYILHALLF